MPRPQKNRRVFHDHQGLFFKPAGIRKVDLEQIELTVDELEALRLAHLEGYYQVAVASAMGVSRQTAARILSSAHKKITDALVNQKCINVTGGNITQHEELKHCPKCGHEQRPRRRRHGCPKCDEE